MDTSMVMSQTAQPDDVCCIPSPSQATACLSGPDTPDLGSSWLKMAGVVTRDLVLGVAQHKWGDGREKQSPKAVMVGSRWGQSVRYQRGTGPQGQKVSKWSQLDPLVALSLAAGMQMEAVRRARGMGREGCIGWYVYQQVFFHLPRLEALEGRDGLSQGS